MHQQVAVVIGLIDLIDDAVEQVFAQHHDEGGRVVVAVETAVRQTDVIVGRMEGHHEVRTDLVGVHVKDDLGPAGLADAVDPDRQVFFEIFLHFVQCDAVHCHIIIIALSKTGKWVNMVQSGQEEKAFFFGKDLVKRPFVLYNNQANRNIPCLEIDRLVQKEVKE